MSASDDKASVAMSDDDIYSDYSRRFRDMPAERVPHQVHSVEKKKVEVYRTGLDLRLLKKHIKGPDVLDFPIGTGRLYPNFIAAYNLYGYDICGPYIERARALNPQLHDHFEEHSLENIASTRTFDTIYTMRVVTNLKDFPRSAASVSKILKPGGRWIFNIYSRSHWIHDLENTLASSGLKLIHKEAYDAYTGAADLPPFIHGFYMRWISLACRLRVPHWLYRIVEKPFMRFTHFWFVVAEKTD